MLRRSSVLQLFWHIYGLFNSKHETSPHVYTERPGYPPRPARMVGQPLTWGGFEPSTLGLQVSHHNHSPSHLAHGTLIWDGNYRLSQCLPVRDRENIIVQVKMALDKENLRECPFFSNRSQNPNKIRTRSGLGWKGGLRSDGCSDFKIRWS